MKISNKTTKVFKIIKNKYFITTLIFVLLLCFEHNTSIFRTLNLRKQVKELEREKQYYLNEIQKDSLRTANIQKNLEATEKYAREKYLMKRTNEDIFIIRHSEDTTLKDIFSEQ